MTTDTLATKVAEGLGLTNLMYYQLGNPTALKHELADLFARAIKDSFDRPLRLAYLADYGNPTEFLKFLQEPSSTYDGLTMMGEILVEHRKYAYFYRNNGLNGFEPENVQLPKTVKVAPVAYPYEIENCPIYEVKTVLGE